MKKIAKISAVLLILATVLSVCVSADSVYSTKDDPLVSLSYVEDVLAPQIVEQVMEKVEAEYVKLDDVSKESGGNYETVSLKKGQSLIASSCCEIVILSGTANTVVTSVSVIKAEGGINDLTSGLVVKNGEELPSSHYLIISKGDGRGFSVTSESLVLLVRGDYNITG